MDHMDRDKGKAKAKGRWWSAGKTTCIAVSALLAAVVLGTGLAGGGRLFSAGRLYAAQIGESISSVLKSAPEDIPAERGSGEIEDKCTEGYRAVWYDGSSFIAAGTNGRIDRIKPDKTVTGSSAPEDVCLHDVASMDGTDVAVGESGVILASKDGGNFIRVRSGTAKSLYGVTVFKGSFWAAGEGGILLCSPDGEHWKPVKSDLNNNIVSIAANEEMCMAVTREGQILMSGDGRLWEVLDYNKFYEGCAKPCRFSSIRACGDLFIVAGEYTDLPGTPAILSSVTGETWYEHIPVEINDMPSDEFYPLAVNAVAADWDQLVAACDGGKLLTLTDCIVCNKLDVICDQNINDILFADGFIVLVGDGFWFDVRKSDAFRQYSISAEQALKDYINGAYIVDVRTDEEYSGLHIKGSVHIPLDELEINLEHIIPDRDRKIIFYCQKGVRAQKAMETALDLGYRNVYNLGGIGDWPYDTETGGTP